MFCSSKEHMKFRCVRIVLLYFSFTFFIMLLTRSDQQTDTCLLYRMPVPTEQRSLDVRHYYNLESGTFMTIWWEQSVSLHLQLLTRTEYGPPPSVLLLLTITSSILFQYIRPLNLTCWPNPH